MTAIKEVVSSAEVESKRLDKVFAGLETGGKLSKEFELLGRRGQEAFGEMSSRAQQLAKDIQEDTLSLSRLEKMQMALNEQYEAGKITLDDYISAQARLSVLHEKISEDILKNEQALRSETAANEQASRSREIAEDSMVSMQRQVALLTTSYMKLSQAQREGAEGQQILRNLSEVQSRLQNATSAMDQYATAAGRQFNGLNFSIQQIARELPSLAMGPQMFFMAISNNLPIFTDELARARKEYAALQAQGQKGIPVWKQVVSSLFSWQTALAGGITLLVMYGDKITSWISAVLKGRDAAVSATKALKDMQKAADFGSAGQQIANFERLRNLYVEIGDSASEKKKFIEQYKDEIEKTGISISNVNEADNLFVTNADAFVKSIRQRAMAMAGMELAAKSYAEALEQQVKNEKDLAEAEAELERLRALPEDYTVSVGSIGSASAGGQGTVITQSRDELIAAEENLIERIKERSQAYVDAGDSYIIMSNEMTKASDEARARAGIDSVDETELAKNRAKRLKEIYEQRAQISALMDKNAQEQIQRQVELENQVAQARIDAMADGYEKELAQRNLDNKMSLEAVERQKQEYIDAIIQGQKEIFEAQEKLRSQQDDAYIMKVFDPASVKIDTSIFDELESQIRQGQLRSIQTSLDEELREVETYEQARLRIQQEYAEKRKALYEADGRTLRQGVEQANLDALEELEKNDLFQAWSDKLVTYTAETLDLMLSEAMSRLSQLEATVGVDPKEIQRVRDAIGQIGNALDRLNDISDDPGEGIEKSTSKWTELGEALSMCNDIFVELGDNIPGIAGKIISAAGQMATSFSSVSNAIGALKDIPSSIKDINKAIAEETSRAIPNTDRIAELKGQLKDMENESMTAIMSVASSVASIVSSVISGMTDIINANREANETAARAAYEYAQALQEVADAQQLASNSSVFGDDAMASFHDNLDIARRELGEIQDVMDKVFSREQKAPTQGGWVLGGWLGKAPTVNDYSITSDMRSGWQKFWGSGKDNIHTINLQDYVNQDGILDYESLEAEYNAYKDGISESDRQLIEELIANGKQYEAAMEEATSYISGLFGDLSGNIADSMIDAFQETGNAAIDAGNVISDVAKNFAKSWIENKLLEDIFNDAAQDKMFALMERGNTQGALDYLSGLIGEANALAPQITEYLQGLGGLATEIEDPERTSSSKGIAQASQDSVDELNGRATAIQGHTFSICADMKTLVSTSAMMLDRLTAIESNTARLENIDAGIAQMRSDISYMNMKGLILRKA